MKRIILTSLCALCSLGLFAQTEKTLIIHKTDGTKVEYLVEGITNISFSGKAIVNDGDYTQITDLALTLEGTKINIDIAATFNADDPYIIGGSYGTAWGILYSTSPDVTVENGTLVKGYRYRTEPYLQGSSLSSGKVNYRIGESVTREEEREDAGSYVDLEYNTTYYFRTFVYRPENSGICSEAYFYSKEKSVSTGKPSMAYYDIELKHIPSYSLEIGCVLPTEEAWAAFDEQYPYFTAAERDTLIKYWNEYLTPERIGSVKAQCNTVHDCAEGMLYLLDNISEDFCHYLLSLCEGEYVMQGYSETFEEAQRTYIECDASWNVPGNGYWEYYSSNSNPTVEIPLPKNVLAGYNYRVEVTLAPNTEQTDTLPSKVRIIMQCPSNEHYVTEDFLLTEETCVVSPHECTVLVSDSIEPKEFGRAKLSIMSNLSYREIRNYSYYLKKPEKYANETVYAPTLRIAQIKVVPYRK